MPPASPLLLGISVLDGNTLFDRLNIVVKWLLLLVEKGES